MDVNPLLIGLALAGAAAVALARAVMIQRKGSAVNTTPEGGPTVPIVDLVPPTWFADPAASSIWVSCYQIALGALPDSGPVTADLGDAHLICFRGAPAYPEQERKSLRMIRDGVFEAPGAMRRTQAPEGNYLIIMLPYAVDGVEGNEPLVRTRLATARGLTVATLGRNSVYQHMFENILAADGSTTTLIGDPIRNPLTDPRPDFSPSNLTELTTTVRAITSKAMDDRDRIRLAIRWFDKAIHDEGVDSFISMWIALETLAMPDTTNIRPINEALGRIYQVPFEEAAQRYLVGRLFRLRSRIVHSGLVPILHSLILDYMEALFRDLLKEVVGRPPNREANLLLTKCEEDLQRALREADPR